MKKEGYLILKSLLTDKEIKEITSWADEMQNYKENSCHHSLTNGKIL